MLAFALAAPGWLLVLTRRERSEAPRLIARPRSRVLPQSAGAPPPASAGQPASPPAPPAGHVPKSRRCPSPGRSRSGHLQLLRLRQEATDLGRVKAKRLQVLILAELPQQGSDLVRLIRRALGQLVVRQHVEVGGFLIHVPEQDLDGGQSGPPRRLPDAVPGNQHLVGGPRYQRPGLTKAAQACRQLGQLRLRVQSRVARVRHQLGDAELHRHHRRRCRLWGARHARSLSHHEAIS